MRGKVVWTGLIAHMLAGVAGEGWGQSRAHTSPDALILER